MTGEFSAQRASNAENVSMWWRHHEIHPTKDQWWEEIWRFCEPEQDCKKYSRVAGDLRRRNAVTGVSLVKRPYAQESRQQDPVTLWSI